MKITQIVEALLFASDAPLTAADLARGEEGVDPATVERAVAELRRGYEEQGRAFQIYDIAGGYQLLTRPEYSTHLERFETVPRSTRLSGASLEVLAIIAYRQPIGRSEVEEIRGVGSAHVLRNLQELDLIDVVGRGEGLGRPLLYGTTQRFLDHFGFASLDDLPRPDELPVVLTERRATDAVDGGLLPTAAPEPPAATVARPEGDAETPEPSHVGNEESASDIDRDIAPAPRTRP
jgi:segregation and condensation protein B